MSSIRIPTKFVSTVSVLVLTSVISLTGYAYKAFSQNHDKVITDSLRIDYLEQEILSLNATVNEIQNVQKQMAEDSKISKDNTRIIIGLLQ